jgi:NitT/TauT family transport system ATP-binding protein
MTIEVKNVYKKFTSEKKEFNALENINLHVEEGEFLAILGPSGCGKTTLLRMMAGLEQPSRGVITENGEPVEGPSINRGFVFQQYSLFPWRTVLDNVVFGPEVRGIEKEERYHMAGEYTELVGLSSFQNSYPHELSGGMKQRVAIARALVNDPKTLLMDEPFGALDVQTRHNLQEELVRIWQRELKTIVFVTHNVDEAIFMADRVVVLSNSPGKVINNFDIELERIRKRDSPEYLKIKGKINNLLEYKF